ncbi:hypothetical protein ACFYL6_20315 [Micromonospora sp. NPDC007208]|uniref:hypothetical protein n=1 Tax=Micromonospora sp. NPDC007208 TaxID=3364236 RepID=UPI0036A8D3DF
MWGAHIEEEQIVLHYLGALDPGQSELIHRHLQVCAGCRALADEIVETVAALAMLGLPGEAASSGEDGDPSTRPGGR